MSEDSQEILERLGNLEQQVRSLEAQRDDLANPFFRVFVAALTDPESSRKQWKEQTVIGGEVEEFPDGRRCDTDADDAALIQLDDERVVLEVVDRGTHRYLDITGREGVFGVRVAKDGGANGSQTTQATWTYTVTDLNGTQLGVNVQLKDDIHGRRPNGLMNYGESYGIAFYDADRLILVEAFEYEDTGEGCTPA